MEGVPATETFSLGRITSCGMICRVFLVRTDVSEEPSASIIRVTRTGEPETTLAVTSNRQASVVPGSPILVTLMMEALRSFETSVLTRATRRDIPKDVSPARYELGFYIPEDGILHSHCRENLKSSRTIEISPTAGQ
jgi:hypothetical protein